MRFSETQYPKPKKRECQVYLNDQLKEAIKKNPSLYGDIIVLSGPDLQFSATPYIYEDIAKKVIAVDHDPVQINLATNKLFVNTVLKTEWPVGSIVLELTDVFTKTKQLLNVSRPQLRGLDLDFCCTLNDTILKDIEKTLTRLVLSDISDFWVRITTAMRRMTKKETENRQLYLFCYLCKLNKKAIINSSYKTYKDYHGSPMSSFQMIYQKAA